MDVKTLWNKVMYGNVEKNFYGYHNNLINSINKKTTRLLYMLAFIFCAFLSLIYLIPGETDDIAVFYVSFTFLYGVVCIVAYFILNKYPRSVHILFWIFEVFCLINVIYVSIIQTPDQIAVTYFFIVLILPMAYICKPWQSIVEVIIAYITFIICDLIVRRDYPEIVRTDTINSILFMAITFAAIIYIRNLHVSALNASILFKKEAQIDKLTNMYNKSAMEQYSKEVLFGNHGNLGLVIIDIDDFKLVNDRWGHNQGDRFLGQVARILNKNFEGVGILGRIGGDEFMVLLENIYDNDIIISKVNNALDAISKSFSDYSTEKITCSCGIAFLAKNENISFEEFYKEADRALYLAKDRGKNQCVVYKPFDDKNKHPLLLVISKDETEEAVINNFLRDQYNLLFASDDLLVKNKIEEFKANLRGIVVVYNKDMMSQENFKNKIAGLKKEKLSIVVLSEDSSIESECLKMGVDEFIVTPTKKEIVLLRVQNSLRKRD